MFAEQAARRDKLDLLTLLVRSFVATHECRNAFYVRTLDMEKQSDSP